MFSKSVTRRCASFACVVAMVGGAGAAWAQDTPSVPVKPKDCVSVCRETANLKTFCVLLETAGLSETLKGKGPFTVFAPTDEAFLKLGRQLDELKMPHNKARLQQILKNHILEGKKTSVDIRSIGSVVTMSHMPVNITVKDNNVMFGSAKVVQADNSTSNGVIHLIDAVQMPQAEEEEVE